ncbi:MAG: hypothetical protein IRZ32_18460 [Solirubrobacteraceae bacterium]|nr:hypothetical protein [Solirubrobacteraceae bacterium]
MSRSSRALVPAAVAAALAAAAAGPASAATLHGEVRSGHRALAGQTVALHLAGTVPGQATTLAETVTDRRGRFRLRYAAPPGRGAVLYATAGPGRAVRLAASLGTPPVPRRVVLTELTTVAAGFAYAQFTERGRVGGPPPGPQNAALMAANLADARTGREAATVRRAPNGAQTTTLRKLRALANALAGCARRARACAALDRLAATPDGRRPAGTLQAVANVARHPWQHVRPLHALAQARPAPYRGALRTTRNLTDWLLPLRFVGDGVSIDGPGNFAIDADGRVYVANNYAFTPTDAEPTCGSDLLPVFGPDGRYVAGSPWRGGGLSGAGFGISFDPAGRLWVGNFGFASPPPGCPPEQQPPHDTVSVFASDGTPLSATGFRGAPDDAPAPIDWPQGTVAHPAGDAVWVANCGDGRLVRVPTDAPNAAAAFDVGLAQAFDIAIDHQGLVYATGLGNDRLAIVRPDGTPVPGSPLQGAQAGLDRPMGIAADSAGNMWIANSARMSLPCPDLDMRPRGTPSVSLVAAGGRPVTTGATGFTGGGLTIPWGIAVDGNDNVWVANFSGRRISQLCGVPARGCRPGTTTGDPISPDDTGYVFDGLVRLTGIQVDPSGNLWVANNWKRVPDVAANPGGYQVVVYPGAAGPLRTPLIGPPVPLLPR